MEGIGNASPVFKGGRRLCGSTPGNAVELCVFQLRDHSDVQTIKAAALTLTANTFDFNGKQRGLEAGLVSAIASLLAHPNENEDAVPSLCSALTNVLILNKAKQQLVNVDGVESIIYLVTRGSPTVQLSAVKLLTMVAAHPDARKASNRTDVIEKLQELSQSAHGLLMQKLASRALREVQWEP